MPPKRKAPETATATANEPPQTRRRTRSAATIAAESTAVPVVELPPPTKARTRRTAKTDVEEAAASSSKPVPRKPASTAKVPTSRAKPSTSKTATATAPRATRTTARTRTAAKAGLSDEAPEQETSAPKRRGRIAKAQSSKEPPIPEDSVEPRQPLSPIPDSSSQTIPKKRGRPPKVERLSAAGADILTAGQTADTSNVTVPEPTEPAARPRTTRTTRGRVAQKDVAGSSTQPVNATTDEAPAEEIAATQTKRRTRVKKVSYSGIY
ncbi:hypothetical protein NUW54_g14133 [Trametes sanguinea]|uniref:Uncharacterized protein n=1 Tax=Trametes sanguinea TaxID=158606 RepID=A0ACC1MGL2_9APHY|nr:hypothetical protein NUW54_g14133 [Trametes sanguinea]